MRASTAFIVAVFQIACADLASADDFGYFVGFVVAKWLPDGRRMELTEPFGYVSPDKVAWAAPVGAIVDGASIPRVAWSIIGGPFEGKYRAASVIHDVACDVKARPWQEVHHAFYTAMRAGGVESPQAKIMYAAVYFFGPRWPREVHLNDVPLAQISDRVSDAIKSGEGDVIKYQISIEPPLIIFDCCGPQLALDFRARIDVIFTPERPTLSQSDFEILKAEIERSDVPLDAIRRYVTPTAPEGDRNRARSEQSR